MRLNFNPKLSHKGILLVSVPLVFELAFVAILFLLLSQAEEQTLRSERARRVTTEATEVAKLTYDACNAITCYWQRMDSKWADRYTRVAAAVPLHLEALEKLVEDKPAEREVAARFATAARSQFAALDECKEWVDKGNRIFAARIAARFAGLNSDLNRIARELEQLNALVEKDKVRPEDEARSQQIIKACLIAGVIFNVLLAGALVFYFNKGTLTRLGRLMDNTRRLAKRQELNPVLEGQDEIAELDRVFHEMAEALAEAMRKERAVVDNAVDVICSIDADGNFTAVNPASLKVWGYAPEELISHPYKELLLEEDIASTERALKALAADKGTGTIENRVKHKSGRILDVLWSVQWSDSEKASFCVAHDITERKELERLKQEFVAMVSHDLRTPLTSIQGTLSLIARGIYGELNEQGQLRLSYAEGSTKRLIKLINDILDIEKLSAGMLAMSFEDVPVSVVVERSLESVRAFAEQQQVELEQRVCEAEVHVDSDRIVQVLVNLLSNAVKFSPAGSTVTVAARLDDGWLEVSVIDRGRGIPAEKRQLVFERFKQVEDSDSRKKGGSGLGLAISKAIIEQHGGAIGLKSEEGKGSTFWFRVPAASVPGEASSATTPVAFQCRQP
jgi:PAS domain S-box-containing protein